MKLFLKYHGHSWTHIIYLFCGTSLYLEGLLVVLAAGLCGFPYSKRTFVLHRCDFHRRLLVKSGNANGQFCADLDEYTNNKDLATEVRIFIPEIFAKLTLGYEEGDSLFLLTGDPGSEEGESKLEFRKTQLRSYFYLQQVILEYLNTRPPQEDVQRIVFNSVAFRELRKAKEQGHEPKDLYVPGTAYRVGNPGYRVW